MGRREEGDGSYGSRRREIMGARGWMDWRRVGPGGCRDQNYVSIGGQRVRCGAREGGVKRKDPRSIRYGFLWHVIPIDCPLRNKYSSWRSQIDIFLAMVGISIGFGSPSRPANPRASSQSRRIESPSKQFVVRNEVLEVAPSMVVMLRGDDGAIKSRDSESHQRCTLNADASRCCSHHALRLRGPLRL